MKRDEKRVERLKEYVQGVLDNVDGRNFTTNTRRISNQ